MLTKDQLTPLSVVIIGIVAICGLAILGISFLLELAGKIDPIVYDAKLVSLYPCVGKSEASADPYEEKWKYPAGTRSIYICGDLETSDPIALLFYYGIPDQNYLYKGGSREKFSNGRFCFELFILDEVFRPGVYEITVDQAWINLGKTSVEVLQSP